MQMCIRDSYTIFGNVPIDMELEAKEANSQVGENTYEIMWGLPQDIILSKLPCLVPVSYTHLDVYKRQSCR